MLTSGVLEQIWQFILARLLVRTEPPLSSIQTPHGPLVRFDLELPFPARMSASGNNADAVLAYSWVEQMYLTDGTFTDLPNGRVGFFDGTHPAFPVPAGTAVATGAAGVGSIQWLHPSFLNLNATDREYIFFGGGDTRVQVQINSRTYPSSDTPYIVYTGKLATDATTPAALTYTQSGADLTFYSLNDVDLAVGTIVWIHQSQNGTWFLCDDEPRVDVVKKLSDVPDANGFYNGVIRRYNDVSKVMEDRKLTADVKLLDDNGP